MDLIGSLIGIFFIEKAGRRNMFLTGLLLMILNNYGYYLFDSLNQQDALKYFIVSFKFILGFVIYSFYKFILNFTFLSYYHQYTSSTFLKFLT